MHSALAFLGAHWPWLVWPALSALFNALTRLDGPTWVVLESRHPRLHALLRLMRAVGIDPVVAIRAAKDIVDERSRAIGPMAWRGVDEEEITTPETPDAKKDLQ